MFFDEFVDSLEGEEPPSGISPYLTALWHDKHGDWTAAHETVQNLSGKKAAIVHAYLHRKEGDEGNARYWYREAGNSFPSDMSLDAEWVQLVREFL